MPMSMGEWPGQQARRVELFELQALRSGRTHPPRHVERFGVLFLVFLLARRGKACNAM